MEAVRPSETSMYFYPTTLRHIPGYGNFHSYLQDNA
jgi:hypothetical protein